jgi:hypothetical protein
MNAWLATTGVALSRAHPVVWLNALDLGARAFVVVGGSLALYPHLATTRLAVPMLVSLGTASLRVYVFHLLFVYGALGKPLRALSTMSVATATPWVIGVLALTVAFVRASDWLRDRRRAWGYTARTP